MKPDPLTRQRSPWQFLETLTMNGVAAKVYRRRIHDGTLTAIVGHEPDGWHLSISHGRAGAKGAPRYPTWDEIAHARYELLPDDITVAMLLPPPDQYVAAHMTTFHLHEMPAMHEARPA